jgi:glycosyltransferase involved in cell wall biosynthesis
MINLSVVVITLNEEKNLARCLAAAKVIADDILVVDSGSTDATVAIAESFGARVLVEPFKGYVTQKNFADAHALHDWVLSIDADEVLSPELISSIQQIKNEPQQVAYELKRLTNYCGHWIKHCGWYPDKKVRLYQRSKGAWIGDQIHESWELTTTPKNYGKLQGDLLHYSYHSFSDHLKQIEKFTEIMSRRDVANGKKVSIFKTIFAAKWKFIQSYFLKLGFLDGYAGFQVCLLSSFATYMKYSKIHQYHQFKKKGIEY